ncbi:uncharacterized protein F5147DRAFT_767329 [Suillus discolor]|uniref:C2 domain-containing protein n=1 Tax=Suillus discolor TaxID=1912936 RepID=A0A9P7K056_9AGAM|nr:uncharacterized protein F5147DRAFT_767329 [Suillus discolor]KAG2119867.1 hypothetical protein F5147DRAFT_767329 [Suillus discolor]
MVWIAHFNYLCYPNVPFIYATNIDPITIHIISWQPLVIKLPTLIHENILVPLRSSIDEALVTMGINLTFGAFITQMNSTLRREGQAGSTQKPLSIPDSLLEFHNADGGHLQLWNMEITFLQTEYEALAKLQHRANLTPSVSSAFSKSIDKKTGNVVANYRKHNNPVFGEVTVFKHTWMLPLTITIEVWLYCNDRQFNILDDNLIHFASMQLSPDMDEVGLHLVQHIVVCALLKIRDHTLQYLDVVLEEEDNELDEEEVEIEEEDKDAYTKKEDESDIVQEFNERYSF